MAGIHQSGGGTGFDFSKVRPKGDVVRSTHGVASGPVPFLDVFDAATSVVNLGRRRRGANMGVLRVDHPDVAEFIACKRDPARLANFNLSLGTTDEFWRAAKRSEPFALVNPRTGSVVQRVDARALLSEIARNAWASGDPGVIFLDAVNRENPTPKLGMLAAVNPCGELPLLPNEACNLGSIRLDAFVHAAARLGTARDDGRTGRTVSRRRDRGQPISLPRDHGHHARQSQDRPRRDGFRRSAGGPRRALRRRRGGDRRRERDAQDSRSGGTRVGAAGDDARHVRELRGVARRGARAAASQCHRDVDRADGHAVDPRGLCGWHRAVLRAGLRAPRARRRALARDQSAPRGRTATCRRVEC